MNITKKRLATIRKTKNQSKRRINNKKNKKIKKRKTGKARKRAHNLKSKTLKQKKNKRKRKRLSKSLSGGVVTQIPTSERSPIPPFTFAGLKKDIFFTRTKLYNPFVAAKEEKAEEEAAAADALLRKETEENEAQETAAKLAAEKAEAEEEATAAATAGAAKTAVNNKKDEEAGEILIGNLFNNDKWKEFLNPLLTVVCINKSEEGEKEKKEEVGKAPEEEEVGKGDIVELIIKKMKTYYKKNKNYKAYGNAVTYYDIMPPPSDCNNVNFKEGFETLEDFKNGEKAKEKIVLIDNIYSDISKEDYKELKNIIASKDDETETEVQTGGAETKEEAGAEGEGGKEEGKAPEEEEGEETKEGEGEAATPAEEAVEAGAGTEAAAPEAVEEKKAEEEGKLNKWFDEFKEELKSAREKQIPVYAPFPKITPMLLTLNFTSDEKYKNSDVHINPVTTDISAPHMVEHITEHLLKEHVETAKQKLEGGAEGKAVEAAAPAEAAPAEAAAPAEGKAAEGKEAAPAEGKAAETAEAVPAEKAASA